MEDAATLEGIDRVCEGPGGVLIYDKDNIRFVPCDIDRCEEHV